MVASIAVINQSSTSADEVMAFIRAMNKQIVYDVAPTWFRHANVWYAGKELPENSLSWRVILRDDPEPDKGGLYGYHDTIGKDIIPSSYVFNEYAKKDGVRWTVPASHEILEMLGNEWINITVNRRRMNGTMEMWPRELSDAVQGGIYGIDNIAVSNFVLPEYFSDLADGPYDHLRQIKAPFTVASGGYSSVLIVAPANILKEKTIYGATHPEWRRFQRHTSRHEYFPWKSMYGYNTEVEILPYELNSPNG